MSLESDVNGAVNRRLRAINEKGITVGRPIRTRWGVSFPRVEKITNGAMLQVHLGGYTRFLLVSPLLVSLSGKKYPNQRKVEKLEPES